MFYDGPPGLMLDLVGPSPDGVDLMWNHPYMYARNNPLKYVDPSGAVAIIANKQQTLSDVVFDFLNGGPSNIWFFKGDHPVVSQFMKWDKTKIFFDFFNSGLDTYCQCPRTAPFTQTANGTIVADVNDFLDDLVTEWGTRKPINQGGGIGGGFGAQVVGTFQYSVSYTIDCKTGCKSMDFDFSNRFSVASLLRNPVTRQPLATSGLNSTHMIVSGSISSC